MLNGVAELVSAARIQRRGGEGAVREERLLGVTVFSWAFSDGDDRAGRS